MSRLPYSSALVTGGAVRIGRTIAHALARRGVAVAVHYRQSDQAALALVDEIHREGGTATAIGADLISIKDTETLVPRAADALGGPLDILINNASLFEADSIESMSADSWDRHQAVNLRAPVFLTQAFAAQLPAERKGSVVNIIDQRVLKLNPQYFSYTTAKSGLWTVTRTTAQALAPQIRVNAISPGPTLANQFQAAGDFDAEAASVLLGHGPQLSEIASAVTFLLETPSMTGQMLTLDGGQHLAWRTADILED